MKVNRKEEWETTKKVCLELEKYNINPSNGIILNISPDYSSSISMHIAHHLSSMGEMMDMLHINVPYPDEDPTPYRDNFIKQIPLFNKQKIVLVEAGIISGSNYTFMVNSLSSIKGKEVITVAQYENIHSIFKCNVVGKYYDWNKEQLEFYWERENNHWG